MPVVGFTTVKKFIQIDSNTSESELRERMKAGDDRAASILMSRYPASKDFDTQQRETEAKGEEIIRKLEIENMKLEEELLNG